MAMNRLSYKIKRIRGRVSRRAFAPILGVSVPTLARIEEGHISSKSLKKIAYYLGITIMEALDEYNKSI